MLYQLSYEATHWERGQLASLPMCGVKSKGNRTKFELVESSSYWGSSMLTIYARAAITSPEVLKEEEGEAVLTVLPAAD